jgi:hypothetical protein
MPLPPPIDTKGTEALVAQLDAQKKAQEAAAKAAEKAADDAHAASAPMQKLWEDLRTETIDSTVANKKLSESMDEVRRSAGAITDPVLAQGAALNDATAEINAQIKAQEDANLHMQAMITLAQEGTEEQKKLAGAWVAHELALKHLAPVSDAWADSMKIMEEGFTRFVDSLSSGSVTAAQAFKGMAQSIIADLLKMWAKRFILQAFGLGGAGTVDTSTTPVPPLQLPREIPFARGAVFAGPVSLPMALMGEAGPEAVLPLRRGANGNLGVESAGVAPVNVAIHNHTDASVRAQRNGAGDLEVIIEQTKRSIAADFRRGGNDVARAAEAAWRLSRGAAAPF